MRVTIKPFVVKWSGEWRQVLPLEARGAGYPFDFRQRESGPFGPAEFILGIEKMGPSRFDEFAGYA